MVNLACTRRTEPLGSIRCREERNTGLRPLTLLPLADLEVLCDAV
jgi:hypothetical protein